MIRRTLHLMIAAGLLVGLAGPHLAEPAAKAHRQEKARPSRERTPGHASGDATNEFTALRKQVEAGRQRAFDHGQYACCVKPACSWCLLSLGACTCAEGVGSGKYACRECKGGWESGQGRIPGKSKEDV